MSSNMEGSIPIGLYSVIMPTACAFLRSDGALGTLAKLMRASKSMYEACSEQLYRHLELTRKNIAGILWGLPYIPPHSLQAAIFSRAIPARTLQAIYPAYLPAILRPPHALWIDPSDAAPSLSAVGSSIIPTGASVARKVALLAMSRRLTVRECPSASDAATITSQHAVHTALGSIFHGVRYLQLAAGIHETLSDYYQRLHLEHPFVQVLKDLTPEIGCIDTTPIWTEADHRRSHIGEGINCLPPSDEALNSAIQGLWRQRPKALWTWRSDSWGLNDTILKYMRYHHPYQSGLVRSDSTSCRHQVVFSKEQGEQPLESLRKDWSGVAQTIGHQLSSAFNEEHRQLPYYDIICPAPQFEVDNQETAEMRKAALLEDIEQRIWLKLKKLPMAEAAKKITFLSPAAITACPCCGR